MKGTTSRQRQRLVRQVMAQPAEEAVTLLERLGFSDPPAALKCLDRLAGDFPVPQPLPPQTLLAFVETGRPDRGLRNLERLLDAGEGRSALFGRFAQTPVFGRNVAEVLCASDFLADILVRNPEYLYWLFEETPFLSKDLEQGELRRQLQRDVAYASRGPRRLEALRRVQRRELLRLGTAEILGVKSVERIGRELADLADVVVEIVLAEARAEMVQRFGQPRTQRGEPAQFCIVSLGKHGGRELNYSSDIDLLFVYDGEGRTSRASSGLDNHEFFNRLGERLIQMLTEVTPQGFLYRVDMRLRPEGEAGSLARSLRSYWIYYESRGQLWERQMLIRHAAPAVRPACGAVFAKWWPPSSTPHISPPIRRTRFDGLKSGSRPRS